MSISPISDAVAATISFSPSSSSSDHIPPSNHKPNPKSLPTTTGNISKNVVVSETKTISEGDRDGTDDVPSRVLALTSSSSADNRTTASVVAVVAVTADRTTDDKLIQDTNDPLPPTDNITYHSTDEKTERSSSRRGPLTAFVGSASAN